MEQKLTNVCPVVNVPFCENGDIDLEGFHKVIEYTLDQGVKSLALFAFNSEPHKMTLKEKCGLIPEFIRAVGNRAFALVGLIDNAMSGCMELARLAEQSGANGLILYPPSIATPGIDGLTDFFREIAAATSLPVMLQDNPRSTGVSMSADFLAALPDKIPNFRWLKVECPFPSAKIRLLTEKTQGKLLCLSGNGGIHAVDAYLCGARGLMPGVCVAGAFQNLYDMLDRGETEEARNAFEKLLPLVWYEDQSLEFYIACEKAILRREGVIACEASRRPGVTLSTEQKKELFALYDRQRR